MKQSPYLELGAFKASAAAGKVEAKSWDETPLKEGNFAYLTPTITWRRDGCLLPLYPTHTFSIAWLKWFVQFSFCWDNRNK